jgi:hypothetical protein
MHQLRRIHIVYEILVECVRSRTRWCTNFKVVYFVNCRLFCDICCNASAQITVRNVAVCRLKEFARGRSCSFILCHFYFHGFKSDLINYVSAEHWQQPVVVWGVDFYLRFQYVRTTARSYLCPLHSGENMQQWQCHKPVLKSRMRGSLPPFSWYCSVVAKAAYFCDV